MLGIQKRMFAVAFSVMTLFLLPLSAQAVVPTIATPAIPPEQPALVVTAFGGGLPDFIELYNQSSEPMFVGGKSLSLDIAGTDPVTNLPATQRLTINLPSGWLLSKQYLLLQRGSPVVGSAIAYYDHSTILASPTLTSLTLDGSVITPPVNMHSSQWAQHKQRGNTALKMISNFDTDYKIIKTITDATGKVTSGQPTANADALYTPPVSAAGLQILEILPNARACAPTESAYDCGDYVKLYNPTASPIDLGLYRLRSDSGGLKSSSTNTVSLGGLLQSGDYAVVNLRDSGDPLSLTNTGGYIWLEDAFGVTIFDTPVFYPDASADSKKGQSWAVDASGEWQWMAPAPTSANYWPPPAPEVVATSSLSVTSSDCGPGRERNPETNRCRNIVITASSLVPCKIGQERSAETNRCRSVLGATTALTPCKTGETRNPETNRCRKATVTASATPCKPGYDRNPETNRCRKSQSAVNTASITDVKTAQMTDTKAWWLAGAIIVAALTYAIYEWRQDIWLRFRKH